jgi:hypothetical protein
MQESGEVDRRHQSMLGHRHPQHFPSFADLPEYDSPWGPYYIQKCGGMMVKTKHWCFLAEIVDVSSFFRPRVLVRTDGGEELIVHFHHEASEEPTTFEWRDLEKGSTLALMYSYRKRMRDMSEGIRHEHLDSVFVFRASLEKLLKESDILIRDPPTCFEKGSVKDLYVLKQLLGLEQHPFEGHLNFLFEVEDSERFRGLV